MAGWSLLTKGCSLDCVDGTDGFKGNACCSEVNHAVKDHNAVKESDDDDEVKVRCLFGQVLSVLADEAASRGCFRPLPALLGDGKSMDLFKLFQVVRNRGGFDLVNGFWSFVVKELGLDLGASASVKLVYFKYLYELERWLRRSSINGGSKKGECPPRKNLEAELRTLLSSGYKEVKDRKHEEKKKNKGTDFVKSKIGLPNSKDVHREYSVASSRHTDDCDEKFHDCEEKCKGKAMDIWASPPLFDDHFVHRTTPCNETYSDDNDDIVTLDPSVSQELLSSRKRKRESLARMLSWVIQIAKCPDHSSTESIPPLSRWKNHKGKELWAQAIRARDAVVQRRQVYSRPECSLWQKNQKMHPFMYEDATPLSGPFADRLRCSERLPAWAKLRSCSCCTSCSTSNSELASPPKVKSENAIKEPPHDGYDLSAATTILSPYEDKHIHRHVLVGRRFQAEVPEWTGLVSQSDSKWLGSQVWPMKYGKREELVEADSVGKGRIEFCGCELPGSVECVRFHIAENRVKLKTELGLVFYHWKFDSMGEEISLRWTAEEEKRYKDMVRSDLPSPDKFFWEKSLKYFPRKTTADLVSYYFNVFLIQRRCYQNRVTPKHIDSDDDESEFGSLSESYGHRALKVSGTNMLPCSENKQCVDFE